jgi:regulator of RNase E activity RraA
MPPSSLDLDPAVVLALSERLEALDTCVVSDAMDRLGLSGALPGIKPVWSCGRVAGPVRTMRLRRVTMNEVTPPPQVHLGCRVIERSRPGDVIVVEHQSRFDSAGWGGLLSAAASARQVRAVIVDGACRDVEQAEEFGLPLFARSSTPVSARGRTVEVAVDEPITVSGCRITPGDYIVADRNGVVVIGQAHLQDVLSRAEDMDAREQAMLLSIRSGTPVSEVMDARYEAMTRDGVVDQSVQESEAASP